MYKDNEGSIILEKDSMSAYLNIKNHPSFFETDGLNPPKDALRCTITHYKERLTVDAPLRRRQNDEAVTEEISRSGLRRAVNRQNLAGDIAG